ncbi:MAG TPA: hypothetical protein VIR01_13745 [Pyrinomonadaceae bacterium]
MLEPIFTFFEKLIDQFSWRRLIFAASLLLGTILCIVAFESYTGKFRLQRIDRVINLVEHADKLSPLLDSHGRANLSTVLSNATAELAAFTENSTTPFSLDPKILKGLAAFAPWALLMILLPIVSPGGNKSAFAGILLIAIPFAILGGFLPDSSYSWVNYILYPVAHFAIIVFLITYLHQRKKV